MDINPTICEEKLTTSNPNSCVKLVINCRITIHYFLPFCPID